MSVNGLHLFWFCILCRFDKWISNIVDSADSSIENHPAVLSVRKHAQLGKHYRSYPICNLTDANCWWLIEILNQGVNQIGFIQTQRGLWDLSSSEWALLPHFYMWKENEKWAEIDHAGQGAVVYEAILSAASHHDFMGATVTRGWGLNITVPASTYRNLHFSAVPVIVLSLVSGLLLNSLGESLSSWKPCLVKYQVIVTVTWTVLSLHLDHILLLAFYILFLREKKVWATS